MLLQPLFDFNEIIFIQEKKKKKEKKSQLPRDQIDYDIYDSTSKFTWPDIYIYIYIKVC